MTHAQFAADADSLAVHLGHEKVAVLGHSYGGFIALEFAFRHPDRLSHLILLDTAPTSPYGDEVMENAQRQAQRRSNPKEILAVVQENWSTDEEMRARFPIMWPIYFKNFDPEVGARLLENSIVTVSGGARKGELESYNVISRLGEIRIPTLVLVGREDWICPPSQAHILHDGIPNSELVIFENSGHLPYVEESRLFFDTVRNWFKQRI